MIHQALLQNKKFVDGINKLYKNKPQTKIYSKACEELSELTTKLLKNVNNPNKVNSIAILEELIDVQMHIILLQKFHFAETIPFVVNEKIEKMLASKDYKKYVK